MNILSLVTRVFKSEKPLEDQPAISNLNSNGALNSISVADHLFANVQNISIAKIGGIEAVQLEFSPKILPADKEKRDEFLATVPGRMKERLAELGIKVSSIVCSNGVYLHPKLPYPDGQFVALIHNIIEKAKIEEESGFKL